GGCGKTRLALQVAAHLALEFADGLWWCDLAGVTDPAHVPQAVASALSVTPSPNCPLIDALTVALQARQALLILDNCEHLLSACAALSAAVLRACPRVQVLATSLQPLGLPEERLWHVPPLALPSPAGAIGWPALECDAARLFVERATHALPSFRLTPQNADAVIAACRRLDGLPLALELAAARVKLLTVEQITQRLDDAFRLLTRGPTGSLPRHQTLRATMEWSYQFLSGPEQVLLRRLSVFAGSFAVEMAESICGAGLSDQGVLDLLTDLVDKSLVSVLERGAEAEPRFRLLETIRQYARERLEAAGEAGEIRTRHLEWFAQFAQQTESKLAGPEARAALTQLDANVDNLRLALRWVRTSRAVDPGLRLAGSLWVFWQTRGYLAEGRSWLEELLALQDRSPSMPVPMLVRTKALYAAAALAFRQADYARAEALAEASLNDARQAQDPARTGVPLSLLAILATERGDYARAAAMHAEALALYRGLGDMARVSNTLINLGAVSRRQGDYGRADELYEEALTLKRRLGDKSGAALALSNLGEIAIIQGRLPHALALLEEGLRLYRELGNKAGTVAVLNNLGVLARYQHEPARAQAYLEAALDLCRAMGDNTRLSHVLINLGDLARDAGNVSRAHMLYADALAQLQAAGDQSMRALALYSLGLAAGMQNDDEQALRLLKDSLGLYRATSFPLGMVEAVEAIAGVPSRQAQARCAARWLAAAEARRETLGAPVPPVDWPRRERARAALRAALGEAGFATAWAQGQALPLDQAVAEALGEEADALTAPAETAAPAVELRAFALGEARVQVAERTLSDADWTYAKSKELFFYLLTHSASSRAQIGLEVWPNASPQQLRSAFHRSMHHLRRALGKAEWVLFENDAYSLNRGLSYWFDAQAFESHLAQAEQALRPGATPAARAQAAEHLEAALTLYRGDFLADMDVGEWAIFQREELLRRGLEARLALGELYFAGARYAQAADVYRRLVALDPYLETAHRELMRCLARQGETGRAVRHYQALRQLLRDELNTQPAPETTLLFERLRRGDDV
ncbi:MAG: tetratricopeptide repeat protein, partial [Anaerolineales bacterium]|nr:tetratricopeptide repeat protein [Anaerolineales bacterium]